MSVFDNDSVRGELRRAWLDSQPGTTTAHEEGGFVLESTDGTLSVERWPRGSQDEIVVPPHLGGKYDGKVIRATFHTHPNPEPDYQQEPSVTDIRAVRSDPDLGHPEYDGEYVIARELIYRIDRAGHVEVAADTHATLLGD